MKTDSLFYFLFQTAPSILFELLGQSADLAADYEFRSVELKQTAFRIDGVFLPHSTLSQEPVFFVEIQFQSDPYFYQRLFAEIFLFLRQNPQTTDWQAVVLFANRNLEPKETRSVDVLLESVRVKRIYLEDLRQFTTDSLGIGLVQLVVSDSKQAISQAKLLLAQTKQEHLTDLSTDAIIELVETIIVYKFPKLSREEIEQMLGLSEIRKTRVYQDALQEGRQEGLQEGRQEGLQEGRQEGLQEGQKALIGLIMRLLTKRFGKLPVEQENQLHSLSAAQLEALGEELLDFSSLSDLSAWLQSQ